MRRTLLWLVTLAAAACGERITAPGTCPAYCPDDQVAVIDSLYLQAVTQDSAFIGYVPAHRAGVVQLVRDPVAGFDALGVLRFFAYAESLLVATNDTIRRPPTATDSFRIAIPVIRRRTDHTGLMIAVHRLPVSVDTTTDAAIAAFFADSTLLATVAVPDTLTVGTVNAVLPATAFPTLAADGRVAAVGLRLVGGDQRFVDLGSLESNNAVSLTRFVKIDSAGTPAARVDARLPALDTYVPTGTPPVPPGGLVVGGVPSARVFYRLAVPGAVLDSSTIVRATLVLVPQAPVTGAPGDTLQLLATGISADFGAKSPLLAVPADSLVFRVARAVVGSTDTLRLDVTDLLRVWSQNPDLPRTLVLRAIPEGGSVAAVAVGGTAGAGAPSVRVTHIPPVRLGGQ